ncbi:Uu.00g070980.m01.CDS01 [Anthostomella pinea]|uniref:Uu.00g070980.m01.CDS01 n=1 Tax=Anthostomella pinea TaxID=933095 RepID=A0AAI8VW09_9PEZI|nr:Uu.00g070980.m01.CDS01 [Anthostomella pinea]
MSQSDRRDDICIFLGCAAGSITCLQILATAAAVREQDFESGWFLLVMFATMIGIGTTSVGIPHLAYTTRTDSGSCTVAAILGFCAAITYSVSSLETGRGETHRAWLEAIYCMLLWAWVACVAEMGMGVCRRVVDYLEQT